MMMFDTTTVSYVCPECDKRHEYNIDFIINSLSKKVIKYTKGHWCTCGARHKIEYRVSFSKDGEPKVKVVKFSSNDETKTGKRFRVGTTLN